MVLSLVVLAHPRPGSFVHALADATAESLVTAGHDVRVHDLYAEGFDPVLRADEAEITRERGPSAFTVGADPLTETYRRELAAAHTLVVAHPNWWGKPPAIMAGWIDRVVVPGVAYSLDSAEGTPTSLLDLRRLVVLNTGETAPEREAEVFGDPLAAIWQRCIGTYLAPTSTARLVASPLSVSSLEQRQSWLNDARDLATGSP